MARKIGKSVGKNIFACHLCGVTNPCLSHHKRHLLTHSGEKPYKCDKCDMPFSRPFSLKRHINVIHEKQKQFKCTHCAKQFAARRDLQTHERNHTGEKTYECGLCNKSFASYRTMNDHINRHTGEKSFKCTVCNLRFINKTDLNNHLKTHQADRAKKWNCLFCGICVLTFYSLIQHMCIHTFENPYWCDACKECFTQHAQLSRHKIAKHSDERKCHSCELCDKTFKERSGLQVHIRKHLDEREYICTVCKKNYVCKAELEKHLLKHKPLTE